MASSISSKLPIRRILLLRLRFSSSFSHPSPSLPPSFPPPPPPPPPPPSLLHSCPSCHLWRPHATLPRVFFSSSQQPLDLGQGPASIEYSSVLAEDEFHRLADDTIEDLQERLEEYGDMVQLDGFDIDYGNQVLTLKLGNLGTYVINKQTPNRQIWLSSPVSGPSRFDWDNMSHAWVYRRTKANLLQLLQYEMEELCGKPINLC